MPQTESPEAETKHPTPRNAKLHARSPLDPEPRNIEAKKLLPRLFLRSPYSNYAMKELKTLF